MKTHRSGHAGSGRGTASNGHKFRRRRYTRHQRPSLAAYSQRYPVATIILSLAALAWIVGVVIIESYYFYSAVHGLDEELQSSGTLPGMDNPPREGDGQRRYMRAQHLRAQHLHREYERQREREEDARGLSPQHRTKKQVRLPPRHPPPPKESLLPKKLVAVFGPESSGSTFLATTLGVAMGAFGNEGGWVYIPPWAFSHTTHESGGGRVHREYTRRGRWQFEKNIGQRATSPDGVWEIQHLSLPWGSFCEEGDTVDIVEALVPEECYRYERDPHVHRKIAEKHWIYGKTNASAAKMKNVEREMGDGAFDDPEIDAELARIEGLCRTEAKILPNRDEWTCGAICGKGQYDGYALYPQRFSVNITSHIEWYLARGVDVIAVLSTRDRTISKRGKVKGHCPLEVEGQKEDEVAMELMTEALEKYGERGTRRQGRVVVVSYEGLIALQQPYLDWVYRRLGINSSYAPSFSDGNAKYVMNATSPALRVEPWSKKELLLLDNRPSKPQIYEPPPPKESLLPKRVITVFGLESSGTKFLSSALGTATGAFPKEGQWTYLSDVEDWVFHKHNFRRAMSLDGEVEVQHLSIPFGFLCEEANAAEVVEAYVPSECFRYESDPDMDAAAAEHSWHMKDKIASTDQRVDPQAAEQCRKEVHISDDVATPWTCGAKCGSGKYNGYALYPKRFFVNISSHMEWYATRGVEITAILSLRDPTISGKSKLRDHCHLPELARQEDDLALTLMREALQKHGQSTGGNPRVISVSYEGLMQYKEVYLLDLYKQLGINSTYVPVFEDGNGKYVAKSEREEAAMTARREGNPWKWFTGRQGASDTVAVR